MSKMHMVLACMKLIIYIGEKTTMKTWEHSRESDKCHEETKQAVEIETNKVMVRECLLENAPFRLRSGERKESAF